MCKAAVVEARKFSTRKCGKSRSGARVWEEEDSEREDRVASRLRVKRVNQ